MHETLLQACLKKYRTAKNSAKTSLPKLQRDIGRINLCRKQIAIDSQLLQRISQRFNGKVPDNLDDLLSLSGVDATANILLGNAFGQQTIGVDTHFMRLSQRLGLTEETDATKSKLISHASSPQRNAFASAICFNTTADESA